MNLKWIYKERKLIDKRKVYLIKYDYFKYNENKRIKKYMSHISIGYNHLKLYTILNTIYSNYNC